MDSSSRRQNRVPSLSFVPQPPHQTDPQEQHQHVSFTSRSSPAKPSALAAFAAFAEVPNNATNTSSTTTNICVPLSARLPSKPQQPHNINTNSSNKPHITAPITNSSSSLLGSPLGSIRNPYLRRKSRELTRRNSIKTFQANYRRGSESRRKSITDDEKDSNKKKIKRIDEGEGVTDDVAAFNISLRSKRYNAQLSALLSGGELESPPMSPIYDIVAKHSEERQLEQQLRTLQQRSHRQFITEQTQRMNDARGDLGKSIGVPMEQRKKSGSVATAVVRRSMMGEHLPSIYLKKTQVPTMQENSHTNNNNKSPNQFSNKKARFFSDDDVKELSSDENSENGDDDDDDDDDCQTSSAMIDDFYLTPAADREKLVSLHPEQPQQQHRHHHHHKTTARSHSPGAKNKRRVSKHSKLPSPPLLLQQKSEERDLDSTHVDGIERLPSLTATSSPRKYVQERLDLMRVNPQLHRDFHERCVTVQNQKDQHREKLTYRLDHKYVSTDEKFRKRDVLQLQALARKTELLEDSVRRGGEYVGDIHRRQQEAIERRDYLANFRTRAKRWMVVMVLQKAFRRIRKKMRSGYFDRWRILLVAFIARHWYRRMRARRHRINELRLNNVLRKNMPAMLAVFRQKRKDAATPLIAKFLRQQVVVTKFVRALNIFFARVRLAQRIIRRWRIAKLLTMLSLKASWDRENLRMFNEGKMQVMFPTNFRDHVIANLLVVEREWFYTRRQKVVLGYVDELERIERQYYDEEEKRLAQTNKGRSKFLFGILGSSEYEASPTSVGTTGTSTSFDENSATSSNAQGSGAEDSSQQQQKQRDAEAAAVLLDRSPSDLISLLNRRPRDAHFSQLPELRQRRLKFFTLFLRGSFDVHKSEQFPVPQLGLYSMTDFPVEKLPKVLQRNFFSYHVRLAAERAKCEQQQQQQQQQRVSDQQSHMSSSNRRGTVAMMNASASSSSLNAQRRRGTHFNSNSANAASSSSSSQPPQQQHQTNMAASTLFSSSSSGVFRNLDEQLRDVKGRVPPYTLSPYIKPSPPRNLSVLEQLMLKTKRPKLPRRKVFCLPSNMRMLLTMARTELIKASRAYQGKDSGGGVSSSTSSSTWKSTELQRDGSTGEVREGLTGVDDSPTKTAAAAAATRDTLRLFDDDEDDEGDDDDDGGFGGDWDDDDSFKAYSSASSTKKGSCDDLATSIDGKGEDDSLMAHSSQNSGEAMLHRYASKRKQRESKGVRRGNKLLSLIDLAFLKKYVVAAK